MYKEPSTPAEVKLAVASDWHERDVTYMDVAYNTGYRYPTICNIMANKKAYFTPKQAEKLRALFNYNLEFLILGNGTLLPQEDTATAIMGGNTFMSDSYRIAFLMDCIKDIAEVNDDSALMVVYLKFKKAITTDDPTECTRNIADIQQMISIMKATSKNDYDETGRLMSTELKDFLGEVEDDNKGDDR